MQVIKEQGRWPIKMWTDGVPVEHEALNQLRNIAEMKFIHKHIAVMPDVHFGMGATVGSVIPTLKAVIPAAVGVDIGCGMCAIQTNLKAEDLPDDLKKIRLDIEAEVPVGFNAHEYNGHVQLEDVQFLKDARVDEIFKRYDIKEGKQSKWQQLGTLGGGNHFIELCLDENDTVWVMLHSGSRGIGNRIGTKFIEVARRDMELHHITLPDRDLAYLSEGTNYFSDYVHAVEWAQQYASRNRKTMLRRVIAVLQQNFPKLEIDLVNKAVNCHHNYISREHHFGQNVILTRKGAVRAREGELGIIPGSMGAKSFIVRGKGNENSFHSCSHGAGRQMSRSKAKQNFTVEDHCKATEGVECRKDEGVLDETPMAYKNIDAVMAAQSDLVDIVHTLKQVMCIKG